MAEQPPEEPRRVGGVLLGLLDNAKNPALVNKFYDIIACNPKQVVKDIDQEDLQLLAPFFNFPKYKRRKSGYNLKASREMIENFIRAYPAFRSVNADDVMTWIVGYYGRHPEEQPQQEQDE